jgi:hypothetical protein
VHPAAVRHVFFASLRLPVATWPLIWRAGHSRVTGEHSEKGGQVGGSDTRCHELLLRLAGHLPDRYLWRYRDWLAGGASEVLARSLPNVLLREQIALSDADQQFLGEVLLPLGADPASVHAILPGPEHVSSRYTFTADPLHSNSAVDAEILVLGATLRGRQGIGEVRTSWRREDGEDDLKRVLVVTAATDFIDLTGEVQRIVRALGDPEPRVEVLPPDGEPTPYYLAALAESTLVCAGAEERAGNRVY